jgi:hypothetical protein
LEQSPPAASAARVVVPFLRTKVITKSINPQITRVKNAQEAMKKPIAEPYRPSFSSILQFAPASFGEITQELKYLFLLPSFQKIFYLYTRFVAPIWRLDAKNRDKR